MPESVECSSCHRNLRVPEDLVGKQVKCPNCGNNFKAEASSSPPATEEYTPAPQVPAYSNPPRAANQAFESARPEEDPYLYEERYEELGQWRKVKTGLGLTLTSVLIGLCIILFSIIGQGMGGDLGQALGFLVIALMMIGPILWMVGQIFHAMSPSRHGARVLGIISAVLSVLFTLSIAASVIITAALGAQFNPGMQGDAAAGMGLAVGAGLIMCVSMLIFYVELLIFLFYLRSAALGVGNQDLARSIAFLIGFDIAAVIIGFGMTMLAGIAGGRGARNEDIGIAWLCVGGLLAFVAYVWLIFSVSKAHSSVGTYITQREYQYGD